MVLAHFLPYAQARYTAVYLCVCPVCLLLKVRCSASRSFYRLQVQFFLFVDLKNNDTFAAFQKSAKQNLSMP